MHASNIVPGVLAMQTNIKELMEADFNEIIKNEFALVVFTVDWSVSCKVQLTMADNVQKVFGDRVFFGFTDVSKAQAIKKRYNIEEFPTIIVFRNGREIKRFTGIQRGKWLADFLNTITCIYDMDTDFRRMWTKMQNAESEAGMFASSILIIDSDPDTSLCIRTILEESGFKNIAMAHDYDQARRSLEQTVPGLIFLNLKMANKDGFRIMKDIRKNKVWHNIPLLVSVGPSKSAKEYEEAFGDSNILRQGKYVEQPRNRLSFTGLVRHMLLLHDQALGEQPAIAISSYCPVEPRQ
jgi:thioredoxin 1